MSGAAIVAADPSGLRRRIAWRTAAGSASIDCRSTVDKLTEAIEQRTSDFNADADALFIADVEERPLDLAAHVPGDPIRGVRGVQRPLVDRQRRQLVKLSPQALGDELLIEARAQLIHGCDVTTYRNAR